MSKQKKWKKQALFLKRKEDRLALSRYFSPGIRTRAERMALQRVHLENCIDDNATDAFTGPLSNWRLLLTCAARNGNRKDPLL